MFATHVLGCARPDDGLQLFALDLDQVGMLHPLLPLAADQQLTDVGRIGEPNKARAFLGELGTAVAASEPRTVEGEARVGCHADLVSVDQPNDHRAC